MDTGFQVSVLEDGSLVIWRRTAAIWRLQHKGGHNRILISNMTDEMNVLIQELRLRHKDSYLGEL